ncbi:MAG: prepilin-type N-terminal cleavage/methylation domain-containing protein [Lentimonas sp.]|jgi:prepilin-type N-terminal cleavage/methylation domain-containing protein
MTAHIKKTKLAFSLIELSVVILIIGILILGVTKGSRLITESKIKSAQSLTNNSPVASIKGLSIWLETTLDKSFESDQAVDTDLSADGTIAAWNDINPQTTSPKSATQTGLATTRPRYIENGINGLPSLNFNGTATNQIIAPFDFITLPTTDSLGINNSDYELFIVYQSELGAGASVQFLLSDPSSTTFEIHINGAGAGSASKGLRFISNSVIANGEFVNMNGLSPHIASARVQAGSAIARIDGVDGVDITALAISNLATTTLRVGLRGNGTLPFYGTIGEIIIYDRALKISERTIIEEYLKAKWGVN